MLLIMFSMVGIPVMIGSGRHDLGEAVRRRMTSRARRFSLVGAFYYLRVVKLMYFGGPVDD